MSEPVKVGDVIYVEEAWEDDSGAYHDEYAKVLEINEEDGEMRLDFFEATEEVKDFLLECSYRAGDYQPVDYP